MLLSELVETADAVASTGSRNAKVESLAGLIRRMDVGDVAPAVCLLAGEPRQGRVGVGWATIGGLDVAPAPEASLTIADLDRAIALVQTTTGTGSADERARILTDLLRRATAAEAAFVRRLLVGEVRHGALEGVMTEALARAAGVPGEAVRRAFMLSGDLGETASVALRGGAHGLAGIGLRVLQPVQPMLASTAPDVASAIALTGPASVEWKLDGIRIQVHRRGDEVRVFTRNLNDVTGRVPEVVALARALSVTDVVLDGEAIVLDGGERPAMFFDCLHVDGRDLIDRPLSERIEILDEIAGGWRIPSVRTDDPSAAGRLLAESLDAGHEGVMVKAAGSLYQAGRRGKSWLKIKPSRTFDLVVLGAEWGHGRRRGWLSNLHLGAREPAGGFVMVGKTFKGLTDELLRWQTARLLELETERRGITVYVRPELVVEIALDGVYSSDRYPGGVALRFARVKRYRPDRSPLDADTIESVRAMLSRAE